MDGSRPTLRIAVSSDQSLVAQAVATALTSKGVDSFVLRWPRPTPSAPAGHVTREPADVVLLLCDLDSAASLRAARLLSAARGDVPQLLLTSAARGPLWGALLDLGVRAVLTHATTLDDVLRTVVDVLDGHSPMPLEEREELVAQWHEDRSGREELHGRLQSLSPRERTVLKMLYEGEDVKAIADELGVSPATVRSHVKAIRRKLQVRSQLAAVAALDWLRETEPGEPWEFVTGMRQDGAHARH
jgi:RNA polymerase sigma factor (sigma-70 family)